MKGRRENRRVLGTLIFMGILFLSGPFRQVQGEEEPTYSGFPISINLKGADVVTVLHMIAEEAGLNLVVADDVAGEVDVHLVNVPWDQALDEILRVEDLIKRQVGNVLHVYTVDGLKRELEIKELLRSDAQKDLEAQLKSIEEEEKRRFKEEMVSRIFSVQYARAQELKANLEPHLSRDPQGQPSGSIEVNEFTNSLLVRDLPHVLEEIGGLLAELDRPTPQILIEARIVEVNADAVKDLGIQWGGLYQGSESEGAFRDQIGGASGFSPATQSTTQQDIGGNVANVADRGFAVNFPALLTGPGVGLGITLGSLAQNLILDMQLTALETDNRGRILSRPKIVAMDNVEATIKRGEDIPYIVTAELGAAPEVQFEEAQLALKVRPHVIGEDRIAMDITLTNDARSGDFTVAENSIFPIISRQEANTRALIQDGQTVVLGGIIREEKRDNETGVPYLRDVPLLSWLFKNTREEHISRELLIFITPRILAGGDV